MVGGLMGMPRIREGWNSNPGLAKSYRAWWTVRHSLKPTQVAVLPWCYLAETATQARYTLRLV